MTIPALSDKDSQWDFVKLPDYDEIALSDKDHRAMEIINRLIKRVDNHKFQISVSLWRNTLNLPDNMIQAKK